MNFNLVEIIINLMAFREAEKWVGFALFIKAGIYKNVLQTTYNL
jgi:hypothetical protein